MTVWAAYILVLPFHRVWIPPWFGVKLQPPEVVFLAFAAAGAALWWRRRPRWRFVLADGAAAAWVAAHVLALAWTGDPPDRDGLIATLGAGDARLEARGSCSGLPPRAGPRRHTFEDPVVSCRGSRRHVGVRVTRADVGGRRGVGRRGVRVRHRSHLMVVRENDVPRLSTAQLVAGSPIASFQWRNEPWVVMPTTYVFNKQASLQAIERSWPRGVGPAGQPAFTAALRQISREDVAHHSSLDLSGLDSRARGSRTFVFLDRHVPWVRRHGYLLATVAVKPQPGGETAALR